MAGEGTGINTFSDLLRRAQEARKVHIYITEIL